MSDHSLAHGQFVHWPGRIGKTVANPGDESSTSDSGLAVFWRRILIGTLLLEISLQVDTFLFHDLNDAEFGAISGYNISLTTICLFFLYLQWLPRQIVTSAPVQFSKSLLVWLAIAVASLMWASDRNRTLFELCLLTQAFLIFVYFLNNLKTRFDVLFALTFMMIGLIIQATAMTIVRFIDHEISLGPIAFDISEIDHRVTGSFGSPNVASSYIAMLLAPCLSLFFIPVSKTVRWIAGVAIVSGSVALVLTMSRGGWLATAVSMAIFLTVAGRRGWLSRRAFALLMICVLVFLAGCVPIMAGRLLGDDAGSAASRIPLNEITGMMIAENFFGVGANNWDLAARHYSEQRQFREEWFYFVHNRYLLTLAELGWIGLAAFAVFLCSIQVTAWQTLNRYVDPFSPLLLGLSAAVIGQMIHMWFDIFNSRSQVEMLFLVAAIIFVISRMIENQGQYFKQVVPSQSRRNPTAATPT